MCGQLSRPIFASFYIEFPLVYVGTSVLSCVLVFIVRCISSYPHTEHSSSTSSTTCRLKPTARCVVCSLTTAHAVSSVLTHMHHVVLSCRFNGGNATKDATGQGVVAAASGAVAVTIFNYIFIFLFSSKEQPPNPKAEVKIEP